MIERVCGSALEGQKLGGNHTTLHGASSVSFIRFFQRVAGDNG